MIPSSWTSARIWAAVLVVAGLQTIVLASIVWSRANLLANGREVVIDVIPVDPRDIFRGEYVILGYEFSRTGDVELPKGSRIGNTVYATLEKSGTGAGEWKLAKVEDALPAATVTDATKVVLKAVVSDLFTRPDTSDPNAAPLRGRIRFGIESYFVQEGQGKPLEEKVRDGKIQAVVAVGSDGTAALKALIVDGKRIVEEPML